MPKFRTANLERRTENDNGEAPVHAKLVSVRCRALRVYRAEALAEAGKRSFSVGSIWTPSALSAIDTIR
jgi:hypothetical protein